MKNRYFQNKPRVLLILIMIAVASIAVRALFHYEFHESALLYVGIPFAIAIVLVLIRSPNENITWQRKYLNRFIDAFIIMFGSSVVLFEGFVCVAMFVPIYLVVLLLVFVFDYLARRTRSKRGSLSVHLFPLVILLSATEGVTPELSFDRTEHVSLFREVPASISQIKDNLKRPIDLQKPRPWFLQLFPMPYAVQAGTLTRGDVHIVHYRYYRWFVTNVHEGAMKLEISEVGDNYIRTTLLNDTSYIANYLRLLGTEIRLEQTAPDLTRVTLRINYKRILDPYWYFAPVTQFGVEKMAEHLMAEVIAREYE